jgi:hypothetical protein
MLFPWKRISDRISDKTIITERAKFYYSDSPPDFVFGKIHEIKYIYTILGYLDSKASALMTFDGVILAVLAIVVGDSSKSTATIAICAADAALIMFSIASCVLVIDVSWSFLSLARPEAGQPNDNFEVTELRKVLFFRERAYRCAWAFPAWAMVIILVGAVLFFGSHLGILHNSA